jgi:hypothetical protein
MAIDDYFSQMIDFPLGMNTRTRISRILQFLAESQVHTHSITQASTDHLHWGLSSALAFLTVVTGEPRGTISLSVVLLCPRRAMSRRGVHETGSVSLTFLPAKGYLTRSSRHPSTILASTKR